MARRCELTNTKPIRGCKISHSHRRSLRRLNPNLQQKSIFSSLLGTRISIKATAKALKDIDKFGGIDNAILNSDDKSLSVSLLRIKKRLLKVLLFSQANSAL